MISILYNGCYRKIVPDAILVLPYYYRGRQYAGFVPCTDANLHTIFFILGRLNYRIQRKLYWLLVPACLQFRAVIILSKWSYNLVHDTVSDRVTCGTALKLQCINTSVETVLYFTSGRLWKKVITRENSVRAWREVARCFHK